MASPLLYSQGEKDLLSPATPVQAKKGVTTPEMDVPPSDSKDDAPTLDKDLSSANAAAAPPAEEKTSEVRQQQLNFSYFYFFFLCSQIRPVLSKRSKRLKKG